MPGQPAAHESDQPIYDAARLCSKYFEQNLESARAAEDDYLEIEELWAKFCHWAAWLGVFAAPGSSLDTRLKLADDIRDMVLELLYMIQANLLIVRSCDDSGPLEDTSPGLPAVGSALHWLHLLSRRVRRPPHLDDFALLNRTSSGQESMCRLLVQKEYPNAGATLCSQLGASIHVRGMVLQSRQKHNQRLSYKRDIQCNSGRAQNEMNDRKEQIRVPVTSPNEEVPPHKHRDIQGPETTLSAVSPFAESHIRRSRRKPTGSVMSNGSVVQDDQSNEDNYPPPPKAHQPCTICTMPLLPSERHVWKTHVDQDVQPYVCISEDCIEPFLYFTSYEDWKEHMQRRHSIEWSDRIHTKRWYCDVNHGITPPQFGDKVALMEHLESEHENLTRSQMLGRLRRNKRKVAREPFVCPLCDCVPPDVEKRMGERPYELLWKHIAQHLKSVAFHSLSYIGVGDDPEDIESIGDFSTVASDNSDTKISRHPLSNSSHVLNCDRASCDCKSLEKDSTMDWSTLESAFESTVGIPEDQLPTSHDDPSYDASAGAQSEWEFWRPLSLPPYLKPRRVSNT